MIQLENVDGIPAYLIRLIGKEATAAKKSVRDLWKQENREPKELQRELELQTTRLIQTDTDYPGVASSFGRSVRFVQRCPACNTNTHAVRQYSKKDWKIICISEECRCYSFAPCDHDGTDGTVDCESCGMTASEFISAAAEYLDANEGKRVQDPGYF